MIGSSKPDARRVLTDNHWHRCLHCLYRGRSVHVYPAPLQTTAKIGNPSSDQEYSLWRKIYNVQNGKIGTSVKAKACCDDCAHHKPCAGEKKSGCGSTLATSHRSCSPGRRGSSDFIRNPRPRNTEDSVLWMNLGRSSSAERKGKLFSTERSTVDRTANFGSLTERSCCNLRYTEPMRNEKSLNETIFPGYNNPILGRFSAKSILKHSEVFNKPAPKATFRPEDYRCGDGPSNVCNKKHYVKQYFLKWDMQPTDVKSSGQALLETIRSDNWAKNYSRELQNKRETSLLESTPVKTGFRNSSLLL